MSPHAATIIAIEGDAVGKTWRFQSGIPIGRGPRNVFVFAEDETLEEQHTGIVLQNDHRWYCINSNPEAETFVDDKRVVDRFTLIPSGSVLRCGRQAFRVVYLEPDEQYEGSLAQGEQLKANQRATQAIRKDVQHVLRNFTRTDDGTSRDHKS